MTKNDYIKRFTEIYGDIPENNKKKAKELIDKLADVLLMMDECKKNIESEGCVTEMEQGSYSIMRENPYSKVYDAKAKIMLSIIDKLDKLMPDSKTSAITQAGDALGSFVAKGKPIELR